MTLFKAREGTDAVKAKVAEKKEARTVRAEQHFSTSPFGKRLIEENKQLRATVRRIGALESRMDETESRLDTQEVWNADAELAVTKLDVPAIFPPHVCPGCNRSLAQNVDNFPGMDRAWAKRNNVDYRFCRNCIAGGASETRTKAEMDE